MKTNCIFHYALSVLEGTLAGVCFYRARETKQTKHKLFLMAASALWFACSVIDSLLGGQELRKMKKTNGGDNND